MANFAQASVVGQHYFTDHFVNIDIDECSNSEKNNCHQEADCHNTDGSFNCTCRSGFSGNGTTCEGMHGISIQ